MPFISTEDSHLTVLNLFQTDTPEKQIKLLAAMREIVDSAAYPGWISSTVHAGQDAPGTANFIQWRSGEDLEKRYEGEEFNHRTLPLFGEITTSIRLLQNEIAFAQRHPSLDGITEISPNRDDYTVIDVYGVEKEDQEDLIDALGASREWLLETPGYRSHTVLRGLRARGIEGSFVVSYSQWNDKESYDAYRALSADQQSPEQQKTAARLATLPTWSDTNTYRVVHTRSAGE
ncbi:heme-degrading monooxygenase HmoA [Kitasatospora sp. MAA4]|uniref:antibiotic biosynthesis monooxygenase n=1 Tax=Kitasatospora sp. MAA4 TaxID=3035093 RepID=UPI002474B160|nr:antibiotic biosynthesis monooxygenase [Kitasatospora sp. MAA4]MDH6132645.1 heme-degrading monooxygenase HmoA [Kitasatospora sp. MAA4]